MKYHILLGFLAAASAYPGVIHDDGLQLQDNHGAIGESVHEHHIQHDHAKSHQSIKFEHFHPAPVFIKKEHSHLWKDPLQKGKSEQNLKQIHPETHPSHGGGLVLEDHRLSTEHHVGHEHGHGDFAHGEYDHLAAGLESIEGQGHAEVQQAEPHYQAEYQEEPQYQVQYQAVGGDSAEGYKYEGY